MTTRRLLRLLVLLLILPAGPLCPRSAARAAETGARSSGHDRRRPNVVLVMTDDQGYGDLAAHGHPLLKTPNLDRLYAESVRLTDFHVDPTCSPTRSALLTGRYSTRTGVWHTIAGRSLMAPGERTIAEMLAEAGYRTGHFGKWHLGDNYPLRPHDQGFHYALYNGGGGVTQTPDYWGNDYFDDTYFLNGRPVTFRGFCTDVWFDNALRFIERNRHRPFFVYIPTNAAHGPFRAPPEYVAMYEKLGVSGPQAAFYGMITNIDDNMGRLMRKLDELQLTENTILIFMTDNGSARRSHTAGLRAGKGSAFDGGHRVPFFIRYPAAGIEGGRDVDVLAAHIDLLPTLAELCGAEASGSPRGPIDGMSLVPLLLPGGTESSKNRWPDRTLFVHSQRIEYPQKWRNTAVMTERWRLLNGNMLFDIEADRGQQNDVAGRHPQVVRRLRQAYDAWWNSLKPGFDEYVRIVIGSAHENPARLTCHDWHNADSRVPWNQQQVANMPQQNGWWAVRVAEAGRYRIVLRHQPPQAALPLQATRARLRIGSVEMTRPVPEGAAEVTFELDLTEGPARLQTWLEDGKVSRGAFFVEVERL